MKKNTKGNTPTSITASDLMGRVITPPRFAVPQLIPEGLSILAARPKTGKSWFALGLSLAVSNGTEFMGVPVSKGEVLYCALEDTLQRLRSRLAILAQQDGPSPDLHLRTTLPRLDGGAIDEMRAWLRQHRRARLICLDTLGRLSGASSKNSYAAQYEMLAALKSDVADRFRVAVLVIHHLRKASSGSGDWSDEFQGSTALTGAADALLHLNRGRNGGAAVLNITGRDIEEREVAVHFDSTAGKWSIVGDAHEEFITPERRRILTFLKGCSGAVGCKTVSDGLGLNPNTTRKVMARMRAQRLLLRTVGGYMVPPTTTAPVEPGTTGAPGSVGSPAPAVEHDHAPMEGTGARVISFASFFKQAHNQDEDDATEPVQ